MEWIPESAAVVHCVGVAPDTERPLIHDEVASVDVPSHFFLRSMAPEDLSDIGFAPNTAACAALISPAWDELARMEDGMKELREVLDELTIDLRRSDACLCSQLRGLDAQWISPSCSRERVRLGCKSQDIIAQRALAPKIEPVRQLAEGLSMPTEHWRLVGRTDRPGFWEHRYRWLKRRFRGAVEAFEPSAPATTGPSMKLVNTLLEVPGVVMVVRQEGGRSILVVREPEKGMLTLDLFRKPIYENESVSLLHTLDDLRSEDFVAALAKPDSALKLKGDLRKSVTTWINRDGLERVDAATRAIAFFFQLPSIDRVEESVEPLVESALWMTSVREGENPETSEIRLSLSEEGKAWVATLRDDGFAAQIYDLAETEQKRESEVFDAIAALDERRPAPAPVENDEAPSSREASPAADSDESAAEAAPLDVVRSGARELDVALRLSPTIDGVWFHGLRASVMFLSDVEFNHTGAFDGTIDRWTLTLPEEFRVGDLRVVSAFRPLLSRLGGNPHVIEGGVEDGDTELWVRLRRP